MRTEAQPPAIKRRRVVFVEYDVSRMTEAQVEAILLALASCKDASFHIEVGDES